MKVKIKTGYYEFEEFNNPSILITIEANDYIPSKDEKWIRFCKKHHFNPTKDCHTKYYRIYLECCINGID